MNTRTVSIKLNTVIDLQYWLLVFLYRLVLDLAYWKIISTVYRYAGFYNNASALSLILSWILFFVFSAIGKTFYDNRNNKLSGEIFFIFFLISVVPFTSMTAFLAFGYAFVLANTVFWLLLFGFSRLFDWEKRPARLSLDGIRIEGDFEIIALALLLFLTVLFISGRYTGFRFNLSLTNVYELRSEAKSFSMPTLLKYVFSWSRMLNSIIVAYFIRRKKWMFVGLGILIQLLSFGIDGSKTTLLLLLATVAISLLPRFTFCTLNKWILTSFFALALAATMLGIFTSSIMPVSLFVRRMMFLPVQLESFYYDFFSTHVPDFYRQSFMRHFGLTSPYPSIPYMIGDVYLHEQTSSNNGMISDAMANLGYAGILIFPLLCSYVFGLLDRSARGLDHRICITVALYTAVVLTNSFLFTVLMTHGLILTMIVLALMRRDRGRGITGGASSL